MSKKEKYSQEESSDQHSRPADMGERVARLEGKMEKEKSQEELYQERYAKYQANVAKKAEKAKKQADALRAIEDED